MLMQLRPLAFAITTLSGVSLAHGAGLDRSTQPSSTFLEQGTFAQIEYVTIDPDVSGTDTSGNTVKDFTEKYNFINFGVKTDINDKLSVGIYYDQPWGADVKHPTGQTNNFISQSTGQTTSSKVSSENVTGLLGVKLGQNKNFHIYGGPTFQKVESETHLRGTAYSVSTGYDAHSSKSSAVGWVAGVGYTKPEIGLKASLTYRSEIEHDIETAEFYPLANRINSIRGTNHPTASTSTYNITTPESYNLDFQTGLNPTTLLTARVRYVPWRDFSIAPPLYNQITRLNIVDYAKDAWTGEIGIGKRLSPRLGVTTNIGYDSGAGNPTTTMGPVNGNWNVGLGARYNLTPEWAISGGVKYLKFGNATGQLPDHRTNVGEFTNNHALVYGIRLSYHQR